MKIVWIVIGALAFLIVVGIIVFMLFMPKNEHTDTTHTETTQSSSAESTPSTNTGGGTASGETVSASIANFAFSPATITVKKGTTVTWTNQDSAAHTVTSDTGAFDSGNMPKGKTFSHTFNDAGTFKYHCTPHPQMKGTVIVQ